MSLLLPALVAAAAALLLVPVSIRVAPRFGLVGVPREDRWGNRAVPTFGGLGIAGGILAGLVVGAAGGSLAPVPAVAVGAGVAALFALGLADDRTQVPPVARLCVEAAVGAAMAWSIFQGQPLPVLVAAVVLALVAVPVAVNATNLVDNADGLAASLSTVTALVLALGSIALGLPAESVVPLAVIGASAGFLVYNAPPARTFMGDAGSLPLGGTLAAGSLLLVGAATSASSSGTAPVAGVVIAAVCVVLLAWAAQGTDLALVVVSRLRRGRSPFQGGTDHTSHRLLRLGLDARSALGAIVGLGALAGAAGLVAGRIAIDAPAHGLALTIVVVLIALGLEALLAQRQPAVDSVASSAVAPMAGAPRADAPARGTSLDAESRDAAAAVRAPRP